MFLDAHVHIDRFPDPSRVLTAAESAGVVCIAVTETPRDFELLRLRARTRKLVRIALGAHPLRATTLDRHQLHKFSELLRETDYVGEVGLDGSRAGRDSLPGQRRVFEHVLGSPGITGRVLSVHSRGAEAETVAALTEARSTAILHWYSGALKHADAALDAGCYFSFNAAMLRSDRGARLLRSLPRERVLTETDGPYVKTGQRIVEPSSVPGLIADLAGTWRLSPEETRQQVWQNMTALFARAKGALASTQPTTPNAV